ncbi:N-acetyltransferase, partial [Xanthomonas citri pv. citri]|nr:N-acetyltransferase [Xanthomonas citri pv. citri]
MAGGEIVLRPWRPGDDLALLEVWGDPANAQQHQDRAMLAEDAERPWRRALVAEAAGVPVAAGVVYASSVHPRR